MAAPLLIRGFLAYSTLRGALNTDPLPWLINQGRRELCRYRQDYPFLFEPAFRALATGVTRVPISEGLTRAIWDNICQFEPVDYPPPYSPGGQCVGVLYEADLIRSGGTRQEWTSSSGGGSIAGPISIIRARKTDDWNLGFPNAFELVYRNPANQVRTRRFFAPSIGQALNISSWDYRFRRTDLLVDNCGIGLTDFPPLPINPPPINIPVNINFPGLGQIPITLNLPDLNIGNWPAFEFSPRISLGPINISFTPEGAEYEAPPEIIINPPSSGGASEGVIQTIINNQTNTINENIENVVNNNSQEVINNVNNNVQQVVDNNLRPLLCCISGNVRKLVDPKELNIISNVFINQLGGVYALPIRCVGVILRAIDARESNVRFQSGSGDAPDVLFIGWAAFSRVGVDGGVREPWHYEEQYFTVPEHCNIVVISANYNVRFNVSFVVSEPLDLPDCCE